MRFGSEEQAVDLFRRRNEDESLTITLLCGTHRVQRGTAARLLCLLVGETNHVQVLDVAMSLLKKLL